MRNHDADDGRITTPPTELEPLLKGAFPAFVKLLGHMRLFYMADEIWDGDAMLIFNADKASLAAIALGEGFFEAQIAGEHFHIADDALPQAVLDRLKDTIPLERHRKKEQLTMNLTDASKFPCGYRCDMCLLHKSKNESDYTASTEFAYLNWLCYHNCVPGIDIEKPKKDEPNEWCCQGCASSPWKNECRYFICPTQKGFKSCLECGEYHTCDVQRDGHYAAQCNLGMTADEVTKLVIPYCMKERFDIYRNAL